MLFSFLHYVPLKKAVFDWVIGGSRANLIRQGVYRIKVLKGLKKIIVEGNSMVRELNQMGLNNVVCVPNFKPIEYLAKKKEFFNKDYIRFVFLSRVHPSKGVKEIIDACISLNGHGFENRYLVDFYGAFDTDYQASFNNLIAPLHNVHYKGFLNLMDKNGYDELSSYDVMLFPTYWEGEGFPGVVIDAYMAGLPIIASDWSMNKEVVEDNKTGFIIPVHDSHALAEKMKLFIDARADLCTLSNNCIERVQHFDYRKVVNRQLLIELGLIEE